MKLNISDDAVHKATGKHWPEWFKIFDAAGTKKMNHKQIVAVTSKHCAGGWWHQMVSVMYEQTRGLRKPHETPAGYQVSASRMIDAPIEKAFEAWVDPKLRKRWLKETKIVIRKATPNKSLRLGWLDGKSLVAVNFYPKPGGRCQVVADHTKISNETSAAKMKAFWGEALDRLKAMLQR